MTQKLDDAYHRPVLLDLVERLGGPVQLPIAYPEEMSALYDADLVPPVIYILELRTANVNLLRLKGML